jgi:hypothetical protein
MTRDFWNQISELESLPRRERASELQALMLATPWDSLSETDKIEFFNELLRLEELFPGVVADNPVEVLTKIASDHRQGHRQDQISKAAILGKVSDVAPLSHLLSLVQDENQDLDTRNLAIRKAWNRRSAVDDEVVPALRQFLRELLPLARERDEPASSFVVGLSFFLFRYRGRHPEDHALIQEVYALSHPTRPTPRISELESWFSLQGTMGGLIPEPLQRG